MMSIGIILQRKRGKEKTKVTKQWESEPKIKQRMNIKDVKEQTEIERQQQRLIGLSSNSRYRTKEGNVQKMRWLENKKETEK